jgi:hypothetical protein
MTANGIELTVLLDHRQHAQHSKRNGYGWRRGGNSRSCSVRISGWLMYDGQHPEQLPPGTPSQPPTRATLWEIHPIMKVEFKQNGVWKTL